MISVTIGQIFFLIFGFIILFCTRSGEAIKCYECNSHNDTRCALEKEKLPENMIVDCQTKTEGAKYSMCRKITQSIDFEVNGLQPDSRIIRGCGWDDSNYKGRCYQRSGFGGRQEVCSCLTDNCNSATAVKISIVTVTLVGALQLSIARLIF